MESVRKRDGRSLDHKALEDIRIQAVQRVEAGEAPSAVMRVMGFARTVIYDWLNKYRAGGILAHQVRAHAQSRGGACGAQVFQDGLVAVQRAGGPVLGDLAEQAVFDGVPLRGGRRVVGHGHAQAVPVAEAVLQVEFPGARRATVANAAVGQDLQRVGVGIVLAALGAPPFLDAVDGERWGVGGLADEDGAGVGPRVVDAVGDGESLSV